MEILDLGKTELPPDVIEEYLGSLASIYTPEVSLIQRKYYGQSIIETHTA